MKKHVITAAVCSFFFGLGAYAILSILPFEDTLLLSVLAMLIMYLLLFPYLVFHQKATDKKYTEIEKEILSPVFHKANGNFILAGNGVKNGNIYFCEDRLVFVSLEAKPYIKAEILREKISHFGFDEVQLNIDTNDGRHYSIVMPNAKKVAEILKERGWI